MYASFGTIIAGTHRPEDIIPAFADALRALAVIPDDPPLLDLLARADAWTEDSDDDHLVAALFSALEQFSPPYGYFGAHPGDGADFGFWPDEDAIERMRDDDVLIVADLADVPDDYAGEVCIANDHGNATFGAIAGGVFQPIWSLV